MANLSITVIDGNNIAVAVSARATQTVTIDRSVSGPSGPPGITWQGAWNSSTYYVLNDAVSIGGTSYICILANTNQTPPNGTYWNVLAQSGSVTSVGLSAPALFTVSGSPITSSGTLALTYSGTALPVANGGTGLTSLTAGYIPFGAGTSAFNSSSNLFWNSSTNRLGIGTASPIGRITSIDSATAKLVVGYDATTTDAVVPINKDPQIQVTGGGTSNNSPNINLIQVGIGGVNIAQAASTLGLSATRGATAGTRVAVANTDLLGEVAYFGDDGTNVRSRGTFIQSVVDTTTTAVSTGVIPARLVMGTTSNASIQFITNGGSYTGGSAVKTTNVRMTVDSSGNVGVGTASPVSKLQITDTVAITNTSGNQYLLMGNQDSSGTNKPTIIRSSNALLQFGIGDNWSSATGGTFTPYLNVAAAGNVGIGTASPSQKLDVQGNINTLAGGQLGWGGALNYYIQSDNSTYLRFATGGSVRLTVDSSGNVGIGTSSPSVLLDVRGAAYFTSASGIRVLETVAGNGVEIVGGATNNLLSYNRTSAAYLPIRWRAGIQSWEVDNTERMRLDSSGNLGIANAFPTQKLDVQGNTIVSGYSYFTNANNWMQYDGTNVLGIRTGGDFVAYTGGFNERLRITSTGGVSFGATGTAYGTSGQVLTSAGNAPPTWTTPTTGTVTSVSWTGGIVSVATATTTPAFTVAGTSGGIPYFSSASTWASSAALAANAIVLGGGAGAAPATTTTGTGVVTALGNATNATGGLTTTDGTATLTNKRITSRVLVSSANSATPTINTDNYDMMVITGQSVAITSFTTNLTGTPTNGQKLWISVTGTGAVAITWGASFESSTVTLPTTTVTTARLDVGFVWNAATNKWRCVASA